MLRILLTAACVLGFCGGMETQFSAQGEPPAESGDAELLLPVGDAPYDTCVEVGFSGTKQTSLKFYMDEEKVNGFIRWMNTDEHFTLFNRDGPCRLLMALRLDAEVSPVRVRVNAVDFHDNLVFVRDFEYQTLAQDLARQDRELSGVSRNYFSRFQYRFADPESRGVSVLRVTREVPGGSVTEIVPIFSTEKTLRALDLFTLASDLSAAISTNRNWTEDAEMVPPQPLTDKVALGFRLDRGGVEIVGTVEGRGVKEAAEKLRLLDAGATISFIAFK